MTNKVCTACFTHQIFIPFYEENFKHLVSVCNLQPVCLISIFALLSRIPGCWIGVEPIVSVKSAMSTKLNKVQNAQRKKLLCLKYEF